MNSMVSRVSTPSAPILGQTFSQETQYRLGRIVEPGEYSKIEVGPVPVRVRNEAERTLAKIGPLHLIGLAMFSDWIEPFFVTAGGRAVSKADQDKHIGLLYRLISDMPAEIFTEENQRRLAKVSEFIPTAAKIQQVLGEQAAKVVATRKALMELAKPPQGAAAAAAPTALTEQEQAEEHAAIERRLLEYKASLAAGAIGPEVKKSYSSVPVAPEALAALRGNNPLIVAAQTANQRANRSE